MKKFLGIFLLVIVALVFGLAPQANALSLAVGDTYYLGHINDGIPSNPAN